MSNSYLTPGDLGDVLYGLPAMRDLGNGILYLCDRPFVKQLSGERYEMIRPLLKAMPYIEDVRWHSGEPITHDFTNWRSIYGRGRTLAAAQAIYIGAPADGSLRKWIDVKALPTGRIILHRSPRYHNDVFPWGDIVEYFGGRALFIGPRHEYDDFANENGSCDWYHPRNFLEIAQLIAGSELFIGNQSSPFAVAEGMKHNVIQETSLRSTDCIFMRPNAQHIKGDAIDFIDPKTKSLVKLKAPNLYFHSINATRPVPIGDGKHVKFEMTSQFAGTWAGVYGTNNRKEVRALRGQSHFGITQITQTEYDRAKLNKAA